MILQIAEPNPSILASITLNLIKVEKFYFETLDFENKKNKVFLKIRHTLNRETQMESMERIDG